MRSVLKVSELNKSTKERAYQESLHGKYEVLRGVDIESGESVGKVHRYSEGMMNGLILRESVKREGGAQCGKYQQV